MTRWQPLGLEDGVVDSIDQYRIAKNYFRAGVSDGHVQGQGFLPKRSGIHARQQSSLRITRGSTCDQLHHPTKR